MSDQSMGENWWQASDGKWYPPESRPADPAAPPEPLAAPTPSAPPPSGTDAAASTPQKQAGKQNWLLIGLGALVVVLVAALVVVLVGGNESDDDQRSDPVVATTQSEDDGDNQETGTTAESSDEADDAEDSDDADDTSGAAADVNSCELVDEQTVRLDVTNNSSTQSSYTIDVIFLDDDGVRIADEPFFVSYVRAGERAVEDGFAFNGEGAASCEVVDVDRYEDESDTDLDAATCEVGGEDFAGDVEVDFVVENTSSDQSDFDVVAALIRDGVRVGTSTTFIENVRPGETAPGEGFSITDGPSSDVTCEIVYVSRISD